MNAVDFSSFTDVPSAAQVQCWKDQGIGLAIIGTRGNRRDFQSQALACLTGGLALEAYVYLYWNEPGAAQAVNALGIIGTVPVRRIWLDVEFDDRNPWPGMLACNTVLSGAYGALQGRETGLYTSRSMWGQSGLGTRYSEQPLWDAAYHDPPDPFVAYGGWTSRTMVQYAGSVDVCGLNVDMSQLEEDEMTPEQMAELKGYIDMKFVALIGWIVEQEYIKKQDLVKKP